MGPLWCLHGQFSVSALCTGLQGPQSELICISFAAIVQNLRLSHHRAFQVIIYQQNESISQHKKDPSFIFTPWAHLIWAQPVLIQHIICGTVLPLSGVLYLRVPAAESSAVQMGSRTCYSLGMEICARAWNNNTNVYIRSLFLLTPSFCKRYNGFRSAGPSDAR